MQSTKISMSVSNGAAIPHFMPIWEGAVVPRGIEPELHVHQGKESGHAILDGAYDVAEVALSWFVHVRGQGYPLVGLPVFATRHFMERMINLSTHSDVEDLSELKGRRVGVHLYWNSEYVWIRNLLAWKHGVAPRDVHWVTNRPERLPTQVIPPDVTVEIDSQGRDTDRLLVDGAVDAVFGLGPGGRPRDQLSPEQIAAHRRDPYPDMLEAQRSTYKHTGVLPMTSAIVMREELAAEKPWVVESLYEAFVASKKYLGLNRLMDILLPTGHWPLLGGTKEDLQELVGEDPWPYGIEANRQALETYLTEAHEQGLISQPLSVDSLFASNLPNSAR